MILVLQIFLPVNIMILPIFASVKFHNQVFCLCSCFHRIGHGFVIGLQSDSRRTLSLAAPMLFFENSFHGAPKTSYSSKVLKCLLNLSVPV